MQLVDGSGACSPHRPSGCPAAPHVLLSIQEYRRLTDKGARIADLLALSGAETAEMEIRRRRDLPEPADLS